MATSDQPTPMVSFFASSAAADQRLFHQEAEQGLAQGAGREGRACQDAFELPAGEAGDNGSVLRWQRRAHPRPLLLAPVTDRFAAGGLIRGRLLLLVYTQSGKMAIAIRISEPGQVVPATRIFLINDKG